MTYKIDDRVVEIKHIAYEYNEYAYVDEAVFQDNEQALTEEQLEKLNERYGYQIYQEACEWAQAAAYDWAKDYYKYGE